MEPKTAIFRASCVEIQTVCLYGNDYLKCGISSFCVLLVPEFLGSSFLKAVFVC